MGKSLESSEHVGLTEGIGYRVRVANFRSLIREPYKTLGFRVWGLGFRVHVLKGLLLLPELEVFCQSSHAWLALEAINYNVNPNP